MATQSEKKLDIVDIAMKKRRLKLYEKVSRGDTLSRAELRELKKFEDGETDPGIVDSWKDIERVFGVSEMTVSRWIKNGMPTRPDGKFCIVDIQEWRNSPGSRKATAPGKDKQQLSWDDRWRRARALEYEQRVKEKNGDLVTLKEIEDGLVQSFMAIKQALLRLPQTLAVRLENKDQRDILLESTELINGIITMISQERIFTQYKKKVDEKVRPGKKKNAHPRSAKNRKA